MIMGHRNNSLTISFTLLVLLFITVICKVSSQSCPSGWVQRPGTYDCYYFGSEVQQSWDQARATCGSRESDLTSIDRPGENEWIISQISRISSTVDFWIGLSDTNGDLSYVWSDGAFYDPSTASWAPNEPSHGQGTRVCVAMSAPNHWGWKDVDCTANKAFVCHRTTNDAVNCDESNGWMSRGGNCYYTSSRWLIWDDAQAFCGYHDANLMDVKDEDEQAYLTSLVQSAQDTVWIGYKTTSGKESFQWASGSTDTFTQWDLNEPKDQDELCTLVEDKGAQTGNWTSDSCYISKRFICEKPSGMCYPGWKMHDGYCYQLISNAPTTWIGAKQYCEQRGAILLTIKNENEQEFVNQQLPSFSQAGIENIWLGISDTVNDGVIRWTDGQPLNAGDYQNWPGHNTPANVPNEDQCGSIYSGSSVGQWDYGDCFNVFSFACKIKEGAPVTPVNPAIPTGYCPTDWYHYNNYCYYVNDTGIPFDEAEQVCVGHGGHLASIHSAEEMSFIEIRLGMRDYYVGLNDKTTESTYVWTDGTPFDFNNWDLNEPNDHGGLEDCVHVRGPYTTPSGVWNDISCSAEYAFICKRVADAATPPPPTNPPKIDCYEPFQPYYDKAQITLDGDACLYWRDMTDRQYNPIDYPNAQLEENYCRNPNNGPRPWCYVQVGMKECDIQQCDAPQDCYEGDGYLYRGKAHQTGSGDACLPWDSLDDSAFYNPEKYPENGLEGNYCRNPSGATFGPWCYYQKRSTFGYLLSSCDLPKCNNTGCYEGSGKNYRGSADFAENGQQCVKWENATAMPYNPVNSPTSGLDHNYCRNPGGEIDEPWCYVEGGDASLLPLSCGVPHCTAEVGCYVGKGSAYRGKANYVTIGRTCLDWVDFIDEFYPVALPEFAETSYHAIRPISSTASGLSLEECAHACLHNPEFYCKSFNFYPGTDGTLSVCYLSQFNKDDGTLTPDGQLHYYERNQTYGLEENYCRNPSGNVAPWCYFYDPIHNQTDWSYCVVPECNPEDVGCYTPADEGRSYRGAARITSGGHICAEWTDTYYNPDRYPNAGLEENFCRNPTSFRTAPFCMYQGSHGMISQYCDIPQCQIADVCEGREWKTDPSEEWCYKISSTTSMTFDGALDACHEEGEDVGLLSITSERESSFIFGLVSDLNVLGFWIGATDAYQEAGWEWTDGSPFAYMNWMSGQPDNLHGLEQCVFMSSSNGQWSDENCDLVYPHICKKRSNKPRTTIAPTRIPSGSVCPTDWSGYLSHCYLVQQDKVDWREASSTCQDLGGSLASVHDDSEMLVISALLTRAAKQNYFFGANDIQNHGVWVYGNGTNSIPVNYINWAEGQPDNLHADGQDCAALYSPADFMQWIDYYCEDSLSFVCENENNDGDAKMGRYTAHHETKSFAEAQAHCVAYEGSLATIMNDDDQETVASLLTLFSDSFYTSFYWIGANDIRNEGQWVLGGDPDGTTPLTYAPWVPGQPNDLTSGGQHCAIMAPADVDDELSTEFKWDDWSCSRTERFICEDIDSESQYEGSSGHKYTVVNEPKNWDKSAAYCHSLGGRLATVQEAGDQSVINWLLADNRQSLLSSKGAWIGMNDLSHQMSFEWSDGSVVTYTNWNPGEPDDFTDSQDCVFAYSKDGQYSTGRKYYQGKWADYDCDMSDFGFVCKREKVAFGPTEIPPPEYDCPMGWIGSDAYCYLLLEGSYTWDESLRTCASFMDHGKPRNTTLAYIPNFNEQAILGEALLKKTGLYWIGLHDPNREGTYQWATGQPVTYTMWDAGEPGSYQQHPCVAMSAGRSGSGHWDDQSCDAQYSAVCQKPRRDDYVPYVPPTPSPTGSCLPGWDSMDDAPYCYLVVHNRNESLRRDYNGAVDYCLGRTTGYTSDLLSLHSHKEEQFVKNLVAKITPSVDENEGFWIGMSTWSDDGYFYWDDGSAVQYVNWAQGMPENRPADDMSGLIMYPASDDAGWEFQTTQERRSWICKSRKDAQLVTTFAPVSPGRSQTCGDNWQQWDYYPDLNTCYRFMGSAEPNRVTFWDALNDCESQSANLVSIHGSNENNFVVELAKRGNVNKMWLGMFDFKVNGGFTWIDNSPANYFRWDAHEPGAGVTACITMDTDTTGWRLAECDGQASYMCKRTPGVNNYTPAPTERAGGYCPRGWFAWGNKCLQFHDHIESWDNARNACMTMGGDLVSIRDDVEQSYIITLLENVPDPVWIGLTDRDSEGLFTWADGTPVLYTNWATNEPNNLDDKEDCVSMYGSHSPVYPGSWNDMECSQQMRSMCEIPRDPNGTPMPATLSLCGSYYHYANSCYKLYNGSYTKKQAESRCEADGLGATLISINSIYEQNQIEIMMRREGIQLPMYIGLTFEENRFMWEDDWPVEFTYWDINQPSMRPNETCTVINPTSSRWDDVMCDSNHGAICKYTFDTRPVRPTLTPEDCPDESWTAHGSACYKGFFEDEEVVAWSTAAYVCQKDHAHLVSIHSNEERDLILSLVPDGIYSVWIGLNNIERMGLEWDDESPYEYFDWAPGEPSYQNGDKQDEQCIQMFTSGDHVGQWNDLFCLEKWPFVCKYTKEEYAPMTTPQSQPHTGTSMSLGLIIGISVGAVILIAVVVILVVMLKRQKRMVAYFRSVAGLEVAPEELFNENPGAIDGGGNRRGGRTDSFDDAMLAIHN